MRRAVALAVLLASPAFAQAPAAPDWDKETAVLLDRAVSDNPAVSVPAYDEIRDTGRPCVPGLRAALKDTSALKRFFAAELLGLIHDPSAAADLVALLDDLGEEKTGEPVAAAAAKALGRLGDAGVAAKLIEKLDSTDINVRYECARALGLLRVKDAEAKLLEILKKEETAETVAGGLMPAAALEALGRIRSESALTLIFEKTLDRTSPEALSGWTMQQLSLGALERITGETQGPWTTQEEVPKALDAWRAWWVKRAPPK
jgi:HEAT repeat protein